MDAGSMAGEADAAQAAPSAKRLKLGSSSGGKEEDATPKGRLLIFVCSPAFKPLPEGANEAVSIQEACRCGWDSGSAMIYTEDGRYEHQLGCLV